MKNSHRFTRLWIVRGLGFVYLIAYAILFFQGPALLGSQGLLPIPDFLARFDYPFWQLPTLFPLLNVDVAIPLFGITGMILGLVLMVGYANVPMLLVLWLMQLSLCNSGQLFYSYGWQIQLAEFTFLTLFLVPPLDPRLKRSVYPASILVIWAQRWMLFRLMLGAGLIKLRGDSCWWDLSCMIYHYETQPIPHPLSYFYHKMPELLHQGAVLVNHFVEVIVPFGLFGPALVRRWAAIITILFQIVLIFSGNLAWLNWLTILMCIPCFDDEFFARWSKFEKLKKVKELARRPLYIHRAVMTAFALLVLFLSYQPARNLISARQAMNTSYDQWHLINSYGAFGSIGKVRTNIVIKATRDPVITPQTEWHEYEFKCAPINITQMPCLITPYHLHLDWQIWFSGMRPALQEDWLFRMVVRLLENNSGIKDLFARTPFDEEAPKFIKMDLYRYRFSDFSEWPDKWWERELIQEYMPPVSLETPLTRQFRLSP